MERENHNQIVDEPFFRVDGIELKQQQTTNTGTDVPLIEMKIKENTTERIRDKNRSSLFEELLDKLRIAKGPDDQGNYIAWCPFHPDGQGSPPNRPNLQLSTRGFHCFRCEEKGGLAKLANHLGIDSKSYKAKIEKTYDYEDETGKLLYQVVRKNGKKFVQRRPDGEGGWIWNLKGTRRVLYNLPSLVARTEEIVFVTEGEKDADTLMAANLLATTNPGGAGKWRGEYSGVLNGRDVVILPDNDEAGCDHAAQIARSLHGKSVSVKIVNLPGLPLKGDVSTWLSRDHSANELHDLIAAAPSWEPADNDDDNEKDQDSAGDRESLAVKLVHFAVGTGIVLFHDERGDPYAVISMSDGRKITSLDSREFSTWLSRVTWQEFQKAPGREVLSSARQVLSSIALFDGEEHRLHNRCAYHESSIWIDLDGRRAVRVDPGRWKIIENPPILFRSFPHQKPLPDPVKGGDPFKVLDFVNLSDEDAKLLLVCYLIVTFVPHIPIAALIVHGIQGSAKTTLLKIVKKTVDPSRVEVRGGVRDLTEFAQAAWQNRVLFFDNLTSVPGWLSDALCRAVTGEGWSKRTLYTNEDSTIFEYQGIVGLGGINLIANRSDLLDRSFIVPLEPISPNERREEEAFWAEFNNVRPQILGGILDALAKAMIIRKTTKLSSAPRMADFFLWGASAAEALGRKKEEFMDAYYRNVGRQNEAAVEASPVAQAVIAFMDQKEEWEGPPGELLDGLEKVADNLRINIKSKEWPKNPVWLTRRVKEVQPNLLAMGIEINGQPTGGKRVLTLRRVNKNTVITVTTVTDGENQALTCDGKVTVNQNRENTVTPQSPVNKEDDGNDSNDSISASTGVEKQQAEHKTLEIPRGPTASDEAEEEVVEWTG